jgi:hypothetical protein
MRRAAILVAGILALAPAGSIAQNNPCGAFSCEHYRYLEQQQRNHEMAIIEDQIRRQQAEQQRQLDEMKRQMDDVRRYQFSNPDSSYGSPSWGR